MKTNELMIGDYLYWGKDKIVKVQMLRKYGDNFGVDVVYNDSVNLYFCTDNDDIYFYSLNDLKPIPLTREILEKNGFVNDDNNNDLRYYQSCGDIIGVDIRGDIGYLEDADLKYVHRLQHALRLCGIEKEIEL